MPYGAYNTIIPLLVYNLRYHNYYVALPNTLYLMLGETLKSPYFESLYFSETQANKHKWDKYHISDRNVALSLTAQTRCLIQPSPDLNQLLKNRL